MRNIADRSILDNFTTQFCEVVKKHATYAVVSGFVAIASGRTRGTEDIDIIIEKLSEEEFLALHEALLSEGFVCMQSNDSQEIYRQYLKESISVRYTWKEKPLPEMEVQMQKDPVDEYQLRTRTQLELTGLDVWFSNVNVNIAFKESYLKSDKDIEDAKHLRVVYAELVDEAEINKVASLLEEYR